MVKFGLVDTYRLMRQLPEEARTWLRKAQRSAVEDYQTRYSYPSLESRFAQPVAVRGKGMGPYKFPARVTDIHSGSFRQQLISRKPKTTTNASQVRTTYSIGGGALNFFGAKNGVLSTSLVTFLATYPMTCYRNTKKREGQFIKNVTRRITKLQYNRSPTTYAQEWQLNADEFSFMKKRADQNAVAIVRSAVFTTGGRLRARFTGRLGVYT
jgi:hypothetical protein